MSRLCRPGNALAVALAMSFSWSIVSGPTSAAELTARQRTTLETRVVPAYKAGNKAVLLEAINGLLASVDTAGLRALDDYLKQAGWPSLGAMLLETRLVSLQTGAGFLTPKAQPKEVILILPELQRRVAEVVKQVKAMPIMAGELTQPAKMQSYEKLFWAIENAQNTAGYSASIARQAVELLRSARIQRLKLSSQQRKQIQSDYGALVKELTALHQRTKERDIELRLKRLWHSVTVLEGSANLKQKIMAAHYVDNDGMTLREVFRQQAKPRATPFLIASLHAAELPVETEAAINRGHELAGELRGKARLFFTGIHWWLRGRYGYGPIFHGLVKSKLALRSAKARQQVYMPSDMPPKDDSSRGPSYPDRRHHYTWQWEERTLQVAVNGSTRPLKSTRPGVRGKTTASRPARRTVRLVGVSKGRVGSFGGGGGGSAVGSRGPVMQIPRGGVYGPINRPYSYSLEDVYNKLGYGDHYKKMMQDRKKNSKKYDNKRRARSPNYEITKQIATYVAKQDPNLIYRIVGAVEYRNALECFDGLVRYCSQEELEAFDELVKERRELEIEINLSRTIDHPPSSLDELADRPKDDFRRRGLRWVTALARAELAAMQLGFAGDQNAFQRFAVAFDRAAYAKIVLDGMRTHYWSLTNDQDLRSILSGNAGVTETLAYFRRVLVATGFLDAGGFLVNDVLTQQQKREFVEWRRKLTETQNILVARIKGFHRQTIVRERR